ncbi:extracellular solute-binding protein [Planctomonas psychrotolerans]|uniref:extracellular solute-binding protein n=1 Tax=Planctomonas psychrotolerans TaxID=2528712 RepID=UPI0012397BCC|nr:extracellular solute-binding protein [Planctomonas psychrotolerans]
MNRKAASVIAASAALTLGLTGCSSGGGGTDGPEEDPASVEGTLRVLTPSFPTNNEGQAAFEQVVEEFQKTYPNMEVEPDFATYQNLNEKMSTSIASGGGYDVLVSGVGWTAPFADRGVFMDLEEFGITPEEPGEVSEELLQAGVFEEAVYAYPLVVDARAIAYRKSAFIEAGLDPDDPPETFEELKAAAEALTQRDAAGNITRPGFDFNTTPGNYRQAFVIFLSSTGVDLYDGDEPNFNSEEGIEALQFMADMIGNVQEFGQQNAAQTALVLSDEAPMGFVQSSIDCEIVIECDDLAFFLPDNGRPAEMIGGDLSSVGANTDYPDAAWAFIQAMMSVENQDRIALMNNKIPASNEVPQDAASLSNPLAEFTFENLDNGIYEGGPANWLEVRSIFGPTIDEVLLGQTSAEDALERIESEALSG